MSYKFIDVDDDIESFLPAEAMSYNGVYLENEIEGYRTLNVSGRELMSLLLKVPLLMELVVLNINIRHIHLVQSQ